MNRAAWSDDPAATKEVSTVSEVPETRPTSFVIVELATPPRQAFRFAEQADALRLASGCAERTRTPPSGRKRPRGRALYCTTWRSPPRTPLAR
jgi:hypothetical protein